MNAIDESGLAISPVEPHPIECERAQPAAQPLSKIDALNDYFGNTRNLTANAMENGEQIAASILQDPSLKQTDPNRYFLAECFVQIWVKYKYRQATDRPGSKTPEDLAENIELRAALAFYADQGNYTLGDYESHVVHDKGEKARNALGGKSEVSHG